VDSRNVMIMHSRTQHPHHGWVWKMLAACGPCAGDFELKRSARLVERSSNAGDGRDGKIKGDGTCVRRNDCLHMGFCGTLTLLRRAALLTTACRSFRFCVSPPLNCARDLRSSRSDA
jgi:hypothetical protein